MINANNRLFCRLNGLNPKVREKKRLATLQDLGFLQDDSVLVFDEATQTGARFMEAPICILGLMHEEHILFKSAVGLSRIGPMNQLAISRSIPKEESFCVYVVDSEQDLIINDVGMDATFARSALFQHYGICAYLGTPLIAAEGQCIGTLAVMDFIPRRFTAKEAQFLAMTARWCLREYESEKLSQIKTIAKQSSQKSEALDAKNIGQNRVLGDESDSELSTNSIKIKLLEQLTQELRTPLTSVIGMASVLRREVYGPLTLKQKEYLEIIHNSGQHLISLVEEIINLGVLEENSAGIQLAPVDVEMLCQQALNHLIQIAKQQRQEIRLSVEPGNRIWLLDKEKVRQILYYLIASAIESAEAGSEVNIHVSRKREHLNISVWISHPWLGDGLPQVKIYLPMLTKLSNLETETAREAEGYREFNRNSNDRILSASTLASVLNKTEQPNKKPAEDTYRKMIGLLLACHLAELHSGAILLQGSPESGYRYVLSLPDLTAKKV